jgi:hypothetical protein
MQLRNLSIYRKPIFSFLYVVGVMFLSGCSMFYYGYTKEEWDALSEQTKIEVKKEYQRVMETKEAQKHDDVIEQRDESVGGYGVKNSKP